MSLAGKSVCATKPPDCTCGDFDTIYVIGSLCAAQLKIDGEAHGRNFYGEHTHALDVEKKTTSKSQGLISPWLVVEDASTEREVRYKV